MKRVVPFALFLGLGVAASAMPRTAPAQSDEAAESARRARVYARYGDRTLTVGAIEDAVASQAPYQRAHYASNPAALREVADRLIEADLLAAEAKKLGLDRGERVRELVEQNEVQLLVRREFDEKIPVESISDADVEAYYAAHTEQFSRPEMVRASHIVVATDAEARTLIAQVRTADAARFRQWAREKSLDTETKLSGGDLRYFTREGRPFGGQDRPVDPALVQAAFAIPVVGGVAPEPIRVGTNFSVLVLTGRRPAETTPLATARESIRRTVWRERRQAAMDAFVASLEQRYPVEIRPELMSRIVIAPNAAPRAH